MHVNDCDDIVVENQLDDRFVGHTTATGGGNK